VAFFKKNKFPHSRQLYTSDCGPTCIKIVSEYYGKSLSHKELNDHLESSQGMLLSELNMLAEKVGFEALPIKVTLERLATEAPMPAIVNWNQNHYLVVYKIEGDKVYVSDPASTHLVFSREEFLKGWQGVESEEEDQGGVVLLLQPGEDWDVEEEKQKRNLGIGFVKKYFLFYRPQVVQLMLGLFLGSIFQFAFPFFTRSIVDYGIESGSTSFLVGILALQLMLFLLNIGIEFIRARLLLHISSRVNIFIISDFLLKLMKLPLSFFSSRITGDLIQRIRDHRRIEQFISSNLLKSIFSLFSLAVFCVVLGIFSKLILAVVLVSLTAELIWIFYFLGKVEQLDHKAFSLNSEDQSKVFELITGIQDIKLHNVENKKRFEWEGIQVNAFNVSLKKLKLEQLQSGGQRFFAFFQTIVVTFLAAYLTIQGQMSIGTMLAVIFVVAQMSAPIGDLINFVLRGQMALLSLERLMEIHEKEEEKPLPIPDYNDPRYLSPQPISLENISFSYTQAGKPVLQDLNLLIPPGKVTAIVGVSGSGKTTLLKLLLKFFEAQEGHIEVGGERLDEINSQFWRSSCGVVLQDSYIFSDTIAGNIALGEASDAEIDMEALRYACFVANILDFIEELPLGFQTRIGQNGTGLSQGQKQRLLIARAVYKNPQYLFFDEATNALDAENEKAIVQNLEKFYRGRTVIVVAHRLSTVRNADQIIVLSNGQIVEQGTHEELVEKKVKYYSLVKNQLELGA